MIQNPNRASSLWVFGSRYWRQVGIGGYKLGYVRLSVSRPDRWRSGYPSWMLRRFMDNPHGSFWQGFAWEPMGFTAFSFRWYRLVATHLTICGVTLSYVNDREGYGPTGCVYGFGGGK